MSNLRSGSPTLAVIILTFNEELHLARAIQSIESISAKVYVVDSFSTDRTVEIAREHGATVLQNRFINQAKQFQWALDNAAIQADWVLRLDADEVIEADLAQEIIANLPRLSDSVTGINLKRKHYFMGRWVKHGGRYPLMMLRIFRRGAGVMEDRWMDEHITVSHGRTVTLNGGFADINLNDLTFFTAKHNSYATREAVEILNRRMNLFPAAVLLTSKGASFQVALKRFARTNLYDRLPFTVSAFLYFVWRYVFQLGFLDGRSGLIYHFLQGYWYRFLVGAKVCELERGIAHLTENSEIVEELSRLTGLQLRRDVLDEV